jgi:outer membrane lipoprotein-sorting protein
MRIFHSRPALRWLVPLAFVLALTGTGLVAVTATADRKLPARSAEQLLVDVQQARVDGLSGTVIQRANLGIPEIPGMSGEDGSELTSLISGTHTLRVRLAGEDKVRLAVLGTLSETDVIRNGKDLWIWSSQDQTATHRTLEPGSRPERSDKLPADLPKTPQDAAEQVLAALEPTTTVSTDSAVTVADRAAYELVLNPDDQDTLISQIRIAIDGDTKMPLRVQVFGVDDVLVFEVGYDQVSFTTPDDREFEFNAPKGTTVKKAEPVTPRTPTANERKAAQQKAEDTRERVQVTGTGWSTVLVREIGDDAQSGGPEQLQAFLGQLPQVKGTWGAGRLLSGTAFSAVLTDDGRIAVGAVRPEKLYEALAR